GLALAGVAAERVRPHPGPGALGQRAAGEQHVPVLPDHVAGEGQVEWGVAGVDGSSRGHAEGVAVDVDQHDVILGDCSGAGHRLSSISLAYLSRLTLASTDLPGS